MDNPERSHQAIIAREIIDLYNIAPNKAEVAESLDVLCFAMARLVENNPALDWDELATLFDRLARSNDAKLQNDMKNLYRKIISLIPDSNL